MFVLPICCQAFEGQIPAVGSRVCYDVGLDPRSGRPRAENVQPLPEDFVPTQPKPKGQEVAPPPHMLRPQQPPDLVASPQQDLNGVDQEPPSKKAKGPYNRDVPAAAMPMRTGTMGRSDGNAGFIHQDLDQDDGEGDLLVMPVHCAGFGGQLPEPGTRLKFTVGVDATKGLPIAENVMPESSDSPMSPAVAQAGDGGEGMGGSQSQRLATNLTGTVKASGDKFGFIAQDNGESDMFLLPQCCQDYDACLPPVGARVVYSVELDPKTRRPRAADVMPEEFFYAQVART